MAQIQEKLKNGKIVSFKIKVFLGRDDDGKQIFRCEFEKIVEELSNRRGLGGKLIQETVFFLLHLCIQPLNEYIFRTKHSLSYAN